MTPEISQPSPLRITRQVHGARTAVFAAFTAAEHLRHWFSPATYTVPEAHAEPRLGGAFAICMQSPTGTRHWTRGVFAEFIPHTRIVMDMQATTPEGAPLFRAYTEIDFADALGGTRLEITQTFTFIDSASAAPMVAGARAGWSTTLDKLEHLLLGLHAPADGQRHVAHDTFHLVRVYAAPIARVWQALTDPVAKSKWFEGPATGWELLERRMDVRPGGQEILRGRWEGGVTSAFHATYHDVIPLQRLIYSYEMHMNDRKISVSLATLQLTQANPATTQLDVTEQGAFLDGYKDAGARAQGTSHLLDALGSSLA